MKKALLITLDFPPTIGGAGLYYGNLCEALEEKSIIVLAPHRKDEVEYDTKRRYKIHRENLIYKIFWPHWLKTYFLAKVSLKKDKPDVIMVGNVLPLGYIGYLFKKLHKKPYLVFCHGMDVAMQNISWWKKYWRKRILLSADYLIANSEFTKNILKNIGVGESKITIINPCPATIPEIDESKIESIKNQHDWQDKKILLYVGRLVKRKGIDIVIKSLPDVIKQVPDLVYVVIGDGTEKKYLKDLAADIGVSKNVNFLGAKDVSELPKYYGAADAFIMITRASESGDLESFGMVYLEANQFSLPTIASNVGGVSETVLNGQTGILLDDISSDTVASTIIKLFSNPELLNTLGVQGKRRVDERFLWKFQADKLDKLLS